MRTEQIAYDVRPVEIGFETVGNEETFVYRCPCGNGKIIEKHENVKPSGAHDVYIDCDACIREYDIDVSQGVRKWELAKRKTRIE